MISSHALIRSCALLTLLILTGCAREKLFQSNFDNSPVGQPPTTADIGTVKTAGDVAVIAAPVLPSGRWVQMNRPNADTSPASFQGNLVAVRGDGRYTFSATLFMPSSTQGVATIQFEGQNQPLESIVNFLHLDLMPNNTVRIDDDPASEFGGFPRDKPFIVQVTLDIDDTSTAKIVLSGDGASGTADRAILPPNQPQSRQFGAVRLAMAFPHTGTLQATNIAVTRRTD
jgi:hypothetical protein